ncbi:helix-turn-helix domain-containing protein [Caenibius sp. WL]|uniref:helix-turn-helix domain-containing protein n=1 Tax=Caenibius sp. WL TaxID=2872646 RepID=UPI001C99C42D|nr:helix-turn-helix domain-containing protein [Caenibius sp. WL]QZP09063.1 helix-turn-helix domain-containing protein [Caenibius sp. WL]
MGSQSSRTEGQFVSRSKVKSCVRTLEVIEYFMRQRRPARTIEISEALGIPNSSADEILRTLAAAGYLSYSQATKLYAPSYKLVASAYSIEQDFFGGGHIAAMMHEMQEETGATIFLTHQNDCWLESVAEIHGCWTHPDSEPGYRNEMVWFERNSWRPGTNFAAAMLAQQSNVAIIQLATRAQRLGLGPKGPTLMKNLIDRVARTRIQGYALCRRSAEAPVDSIAIPLPLPHGVASHAVGVVGDPLFHSDGDVRRMLSAMQAVICRHSDSLRRSGLQLQ